jgi:hypothetical protein
MVLTGVGPYGGHWRNAGHQDGLICHTKAGAVRRRLSRTAWTLVLIFAAPTLHMLCTDVLFNHLSTNNRSSALTLTTRKGMLTPEDSSRATINDAGPVSSPANLAAAAPALLPSNLSISDIHQLATTLHGFLSNPAYRAR